MKHGIATALLVLIALSVQAQTKAQVLTELHRQNVPHAEIVLAQARLETGNFTSRMCKTHHNLFGIKHGGKYARYTTWQQSVADYKKRVSSRYKGGDYYKFLQRIKYASDQKYIQKLKQF